jgi:bifunctional non-homologous end joining protein LigD
LQNVLSEGGGARLAYFVFDLPFADGYDLRDVPLVVRKNLLAKIVAGQSRVRYSDHVAGGGDGFFAQACKLGIEGIVSKRADSRYAATRSRDWQKVKCGMRQEFVVGGYTNPQGARTGFGALLLGVYDGDGLRYCGKVGTGFDEATLAALTTRLAALEINAPPFVNSPKGAEARRAHWVRPDLVAEVSFTEWTRDGTLRHPSFQGLREDKPPRAIVREVPAEDESKEAAPQPFPRPAAPGEGRAAKRTAKAAQRRAKGARKADPSAGDVVAGIAISNANKLLYPEAGISKVDVARYYEAVGKLIVPQLRDRPLSLVRCPNGWDKPCFYQKHATASVSEHVLRIDVDEAGGAQPYMMANSVSAVVALLQMGVLEFHPWGSRAPDLGHPDRLVFDFDPDESLPYEKLVEAVTVLRKLLDSLELEAFVKTTGGKGMHVVIPVAPTRSWDDAKEFCRAVAEMIVKAFPDRYTASMAKARRPGRIFIDYLRNVQGATAVAAYSARAKRGAPVAMPIDWSELADDVRFDHFNVGNVPGIVASRKRDPWARMARVRQQLTDDMFARVGAAIPAKRR